jgi:hypothetical protein
MYEQTTCGTWAGIQVLVGTPHCSINVPVVEMEGYITNCMGEVDEYKYAVGMGSFRDGWDVQECTSVKLNSRKEQKGRVGSMKRDSSEDLRGCECSRRRWG